LTFIRVAEVLAVDKLTSTAMHDVSRSARAPLGNGRLVS
jgi:hypothetical protein